MGFLIRTAFWLSLVFLFLPIDLGETSDHEAVGPIQALFAARNAVQDFAGICERQPDVCATAKAAFNTIVSRAMESVRLAQALTGGESEPAPTPAEEVPPQAQPATTGSISPAK